MATININAESRPYFGGLGDTVLLAWLSEGAKNTNTPMQLWASGNRRYLLELLQQPISPNQDHMKTPSGCYNLELADNGRRPRIGYCREFLGITTPAKRPTPSIPDHYTKWAKEEKQKHGSPFVLLFPQTHWRPREWPQAYWVDLGIKLKQNNIPAVFMLDRQDERYTGKPVAAYWGFNFGQFMALMMEADVIVGNDSMPSHLAGTLGRKTIALLGPTKPTVFSHIPDVQVMQSPRLPCTGCHFSRPDFNVSCDIGCSSLYALLVQDVLEKVTANL